MGDKSKKDSQYIIKDFIYYFYEQLLDVSNVQDKYLFEDELSSVLADNLSSQSIELFRPLDLISIANRKPRGGLLVRNFERSKDEFYDFHVSDDKCFQKNFGFSDISSISEDHQKDYFESVMHAAYSVIAQRGLSKLTDPKNVKEIINNYVKEVDLPDNGIDLLVSSDAVIIHDRFLECGYTVASLFRDFYDSLNKEAQLKVALSPIVHLKLGPLSGFPVRYMINEYAKQKHRVDLLGALGESVNSLYVDYPNEMVSYRAFSDFEEYINQKVSSVVVDYLKNANVSDNVIESISKAIFSQVKKTGDNEIRSTLAPSDPFTALSSLAYTDIDEFLLSDDQSAVKQIINNLKLSVIDYFSNHPIEEDVKAYLEYRSVGEISLINNDYTKEYMKNIGLQDSTIRTLLSTGYNESLKNVTLLDLDNASVSLCNILSLTDEQLVTGFKKKFGENDFVNDVLTLVVMEEMRVIDEPLPRQSLKKITACFDGLNNTSFAVALSGLSQQDFFTNGANYERSVENQFLEHYYRKNIDAFSDIERKLLSNIDRSFDVYLSKNAPDRVRYAADYLSDKYYYYVEENIKEAYNKSVSNYICDKGDDEFLSAIQSRYLHCFIDKEAIAQMISSCNSMLRYKMAFTACDNVLLDALGDYFRKNQDKIGLDRLSYNSSYIYSTQSISNKKTIKAFNPNVKKITTPENTKKKGRSI